MQEETRANRYLVPRGDEPYESLLEIKRSEFIGHIKRVSTVEEARVYIESVRKTYHDARHVCSAFVIGADRDVQRSSDDGEPAGTAGVPMMQALLARQTREDGTTDLSDVVAVSCAISAALSSVPVAWCAPTRMRWCRPWTRRSSTRVSVCAWVRFLARTRMRAAWRTRCAPRA